MAQLAVNLISFDWLKKCMHARIFGSELHNCKVQVRWVKCVRWFPSFEFEFRVLL